jgi:hypothetical protein
VGVAELTELVAATGQLVAAEEEQLAAEAGIHPGIAAVGFEQEFVSLARRSLSGSRPLEGASAELWEKTEVEFAAPPPETAAVGFEAGLMYLAMNACRGSGPLENPSAKGFCQEADWELAAEVAWDVGAA